MKNYIDSKGGLVEIKGVTILIEIMKRESIPECRIIPVQILNLTDNIEAIKEFMNQQGVFLLTEWVSAYKENIELHNIVLEQKDFDLLDQILNFSNKMPIKSKDLKSTKFGKQINKLGKCIKDSKIKGKCEAIVERWKKMISDQKEKNLKSHSGNEIKSPTNNEADQKVSFEKEKSHNQSQNQQNSNYSSGTSRYNQTNLGNSGHQDNQYINKKREKRDFDQEFEKNNKKYNNKLNFSLMFLISCFY